ncbi:hypothetical protein KFE25_009639 [Diacronema lutheri]|uniref:Adaptor protein ClpS core domain-containing protein n=2 Tax=Diacronema lutheri TaxID=2081491 RepID=A0A8J6CKL3_DIALT|nr:hypothetical protein KFE25_009639 [Diacronema lutheri]
MRAAWLLVLAAARPLVSSIGRSALVRTRARAWARFAEPRARAALSAPQVSPVQASIHAAAPSVALVLPRGVRNATLQGTAFRVLREDFVSGPPLPADEHCCWLITAAHVAAPGCTLSVQFPSQRAAVRAQLVGRATQVDVALIRVEASDLPAALWPPPLRLSAQLATVGESVIGLGYPGGVFGPAASLGIVCAHAPALELNASTPLLTQPLPAVAYDARDAVKPTFVVTDAALAGGMSGGPLINMCGEVCGINVLVRPELRALGNYALAAPRATEAVRALILAPAADAAAGAPPASWRVFLYNDRMNSKAAVSKILADAGLPSDEAERVMSEAHSRGRAVVRTFAPPRGAESAAELCERLRAADLLVEAERVAVEPEVAAAA